jgi:type VI secretion system protein ImpK
MSDIAADKQHQSDDLTLFAGASGAGLGNEPVTGSSASVKTKDVDERKQQAARNPSTETYSASINPLVAAAAHLLSTVAGITRSDRKAKFHDLNKTLLEDLRGYQARASTLGAESYLLNEASYVLCTFVDEAVLQTDFGKRSGWSKSTLLYGLHEQTSGGERFFEILTSHSVNPVKHVHLLELMYLCLALGFKGKYGVKAHEEAELENIRDGLYRTIRHLRGDAPRELSPHWHGLQDKRRNLVRIVPWWLVVLFTLMCLAVMYSGFAWVLSEQRETVLEPYRQLDAAMTQSPLQDRDAR